MILDNFLRSCYTIGILILISCILILWFKHAPKENKALEIYEVSQYTCSGKFQRRYNYCINFRMESGFTTFDILDPTNDITEVKLVGGIIVIEKKENKNNE